MYIVIVISNNKIIKFSNFYNLEIAIKEYRTHKNVHRYLYDVYRNEMVLLMEDHPL